MDTISSYFSSSLETITETLAGVSLFLNISLFILGALVALFTLLPLYAHFLLNDPNHPGKFALFTALPNGVCKGIKKRGEGIVRYIMNYQGYIFQAYSSSLTEALHDFAEQWKVVKLSSDDVPPPNGICKISHHYLSPIAWIDWYVFVTTGYHWVGIGPWQIVHSYHLVRYTGNIIKDSNGNLVREKKEDESDHIFVNQQTYPLFVGQAETKGVVQLNIRGSYILRTVNPHNALFEAGDWLLIVDAAVTNAARDKVREWTADEVIGATLDEKKAQEESQKTALANAILEINDGMNGGSGIIERYGIKLELILFEDFEAVGEKRVLESLTAQFVERRFAAANEEKGRGISNKLKAILDMAKEYGELGNVVVQLEQMANIVGDNTSHMIWANNPLLGKAGNDVSKLLDELGVTPKELREMISTLKKTG